MPDFYLMDVTETNFDKESGYGYCEFLRVYCSIALIPGSRV